MSEHHEAAASDTFPHDAIARMRQLQQLASRHDRAAADDQTDAAGSAAQHTATSSQ